MKRGVAWLACTWLALAAHAADFTLATLFETLAKTRPERATFHERKVIALLDKPLETSGELSFTPPDRLEKRTLKPKPERIVAEGDRVVIERDGKRLALSLGANPAVATLIDSLRATLAGDLATLTRTYSAALDGTAAAWRLTLRPLDPSTAALVERIEIAGAGAQVRRVEIRQADGDHSVMTIAP